MNPIKTTLLISIFSFFSYTSFAQTKPDDILKSFFTEYNISPATAVENIYSTNIWTSRIRDGIDQIKNEVNKYTIDYVGKYYGYELITKKPLSESFVLYSYMIKYDRQPMRFIFKFYKPNDKWVLYSFKIDSNLDDELEESAKLVYLSLDKN
jgi:hypothetical protein